MRPVGLPAIPWATIVGATLLLLAKAGPGCDYSQHSWLPLNSDEAELEPRIPVADTAFTKPSETPTKPGLPARPLADSATLSILHIRIPHAAAVRAGTGVGDSGMATSRRTKRGSHPARLSTTIGWGGGVG